MLEGIDVSKYQISTPPLAGRAFLIARATYGNSRDTMFPRHISNADAAGVVTGAYHFGRSGKSVPIADQVAAFLAAVTLAPVDLLALDLESDNSGPDMTNAEATTFIRAIQATGRKIGLYASTSRYPLDALGADWRWVADYRGISPPIDWDVWQYRGSPLDLDRFDGTREQLLALGGDVTPLSITSEVPTEVQVPKGTPYLDLDGKTVLDADGPSANLDWRPSPFSIVPGLHAIYANVGATRRVVLVKGVPARAVPSLDDAKAAQREADRAAAVAAVQKAIP